MAALLDQIAAQAENPVFLQALMERLGGGPRTAAEAAMVAPAQEIPGPPPMPPLPNEEPLRPLGPGEPEPRPLRGSPREMLSDLIDILRYVNPFDPPFDRRRIDERPMNWRRYNEWNDRQQWRNAVPFLPVEPTRKMHGS